MMEFLLRGFQTGIQQFCNITTSAVQMGGPIVHNMAVGKHRYNRVGINQGCIHKLTRMRCVDNSAIGKQAMAEGNKIKVIHIYNKRGKGEIGDKVLVTLRGEMKKGIVVGCKRHQRPFVPKMDTNNVVLVDDNGTPLGTRIHVPIPMILRSILKTKSVGKGVDYTKLLALATRFV